MSLKMEKPKDSVKKKIAYFLEGFSLLLSLRVGLNGASFCVKRFQIPEELFSIYVSKVHNGMELGCFIAVIVGNIYIFTCGRFIPLISICVNWLYYLAHIALMVVFVLGGTNGYLTAFYYVLVLCAFIYGIIQVCVFKLGGPSIVFYLAAVPMSGIFVSCFQMVFSYIFTDERVDEKEYLLITFQIAFSIMITLVTASLWTLEFLGEVEWIKNITERNSSRSSATSNGHTDLENGEQNGQQDQQSSKMYLAISPMIMCIVGLGFVYAFYPGIAPGLLVDFNLINKIDMVIMILGAFPSLLVAVVSEMSECGPNKRWDGNNWGWHLYLFFPFLEVVIGVLFLRVLHFRRTYLANLFKKPIIAGAFTVIFFLSHAVSIGVGFAGVGPNSNTNVATLNLFLSLLLMNILEFVGEGYVTEYKKYARYDWPTIGMSNWDALMFWATKAFKNGMRSIKGVLTKDLRKDLMAIITPPTNS